MENGKNSIRENSKVKRIPKEREKEDRKSY